jgi:hypothetical protein
MPALMQKEPVFLIKVGPKKGLGSKEPVFLIKVGPKKGLGSKQCRTLIINGGNLRALSLISCVGGRLNIMPPWL